MFFNGIAITVSAISDFSKKREQLDVIEGMMKEVTMYWE